MEIILSQIHLLLGGVFLVVKFECTPRKQPAQVAYPWPQYFLDQGDNNKSCKPLQFTWYCFLTSGINLCPSKYDSYVLTDSLWLYGEIWPDVSLWIFSVPIMKWLHIIHTNGLSGSFVLCSFYFAPSLNIQWNFEFHCCCKNYYWWSDADTDVCLLFLSCSCFSTFFFTTSLHP